TEELCGHKFTASAISQINKTLDVNLKAFCERRLSADDWPRARRRQARQRRRFAVAPLYAAMLDRGGARSRRQSAVGTKKRPSIEQRNSNTRNVTNDFARLTHTTPIV